MIKALLASLLLSLLLAACSGQQQKPPVVDHSYSKATYKSKPKAKANRKWYKVRKGDTLYSIAWANSLHYRTLAYWNQVRPPYTLYPGQILRLKPRSKPAKNSKRVTSKSTKNTVRSSKPVSKPGSRTASSSKKSYKKQTTSKAAKKPARKSARSGKLKWTWPAQGRISYRYSNQASGKKGIGITGRKGQKIRAAASGKVVYSGEGLLRYGKMIIVKHNSHYLSAYAHNQKLLVKEGAWIKAGQQIALMGSSGTHNTLVHFEIRRDGKPVNPIRYLPKKR